MSAFSFADWLGLFGHFLLLSLLSIGGAIVVAPDMHRVMVTQMGLISDQQFSASIAIAQAAPGPNVLFVAVAGYQAAGLTGAMVTLLGMMLPSTTLAFSAARWSHARQHWRGVQAFKAGLAPVTISLLFATGWILTGTRMGDGLMAITLAAVLLVWRTRIHLLWLIGGGALLGAAGLV